MQKSIKLAVASILVGTIGVASIPASFAGSANVPGNKETVSTTGNSTLIAKGKKKVKKGKAAKPSAMKKR